MPEIRLLNEGDEELLREAWAWQDSSPKWFQESQSSEKEELIDFLNTAKDKLLYGVFDEGLTAVIRLNPFANKVFSIDLFARRKTDFNVLSEAGLSLKYYLFDNGIAKGFFGWLPSRNRGVIKLYNFLGFTHSGVVCYKGQYHDKPVKWLLMVSEENN
jgi:hypothetical protein